MAPLFDNNTANTVANLSSTVDSINSSVTSLQTTTSSLSTTTAALASDPVNLLAVNPQSPLYVVNRYYDGSRSLSSTIDLATVSGSTYFMGFYSPLTITIDRLAAIYGYTSATGRFGVYSSTSLGVPSSLLYTSVDATRNVGGSYLESTVSYTFTKNRYYYLGVQVGYTQASGLKAFNYASTTVNSLGSTAPNAAPYQSMSQTGVYASGLPSSATPAYSTTGPVQILFRVSAVS